MSDETVDETEHEHEFSYHADADGVARERKCAICNAKEEGEWHLVEGKWA